jgi:DNA-binding response OmpR family regulator
MPKAWIIATANSDLIEVFRTAGWEVVPSALPDFTPVDLSSVRDPDVMIYEMEEALSDALRQTCELKIATLLAIAPNWDLAWQAIEAGADDALLAPADLTEAVFRARRLVRASKIVRVGELAIDLIAQSVKRNNRLIRLSPLEFQLLACLARRVGQAVTYDAILDLARGDQI